MAPMLFWGHFVILWSFGIFSRFGTLCREKSGNPGTSQQKNSFENLRKKMT
jgi:hypothetical protein